jgi:hypothetical protein
MRCMALWPCGHHCGGWRGIFVIQAGGPCDRSDRIELIVMDATLWIQQMASRYASHI